MSKLNRLKPSRSFIIAVAIVFALAGGLSLIVLPKLHQRAAEKAALFGREGTSLKETNQPKALIDLKLAHALDSANETYSNDLADLHLKRGELNQAIAVLKSQRSEQGRVKLAGFQIQAGHSLNAIKILENLDSDAAAVVRSRAYMEVGEGQKAIAEVNDRNSEEALVQLALSYGAAGETERISSFAGRVSSPQAISRIDKARLGKLSLAQELYAMGLLNSSERVLNSEPDETTLKYALLTNIKLTPKPVSRQNLLAARDLASKGLKVNPASLQLHRTLKSINERLKDKGAADHEAELIKQLESGKI